MNAVKLIPSLKTSDSSSFDLGKIQSSVYDAMSDDFNTPIAIASLFEGARIINSINDGKDTISVADKDALQQFFEEIIFNILGLKEEDAAASDKVEGLMNLVLELRKQVRANKDFATSDKIRDALNELSIQVKDGKDGTTWNLG